MECSVHTLLVPKGFRTSAETFIFRSQRVHRARPDPSSVARVVVFSVMWISCSRHQSVCVWFIADGRQDQDHLGERESNALFRRALTSWCIYDRAVVDVLLDVRSSDMLAQYVVFVYTYLIYSGMGTPHGYYIVSCLCIRRPNILCVLACFLFTLFSVVNYRQHVHKPKHGYPCTTYSAIYSPCWFSVSICVYVCLSHRRWQHVFMVFINHPDGVWR